MIFSQNIQISVDFSNSDKLDLHNRKLEIATLNLDAFNLKFDNYVCKLLYNIDTYEFETIVKNDLHTDFIHSQITFFVHWDLQDYSLIENYIKNFLHYYYEEVSILITPLLLTNMPIGQNLDFFIKNRNLFFLRFKDSFPLGFLSVDEEFKIKTESNRLCKQLEDLIKIP